MNETYTLHVAGLTRELKKVRVAPNLRIASFVMLGDTRLIENAPTRSTRRSKSWER